MHLINLTFKLGVIFAIFSFIWGIIHIIFNAIRGGKPSTIAEEYFLKLVQYVLLVNIVFLSCINDEATILVSQLILSSLILIMYFVSKFQKRQRNNDFFQSIKSSFKKELNNNQLPFNFPGLKLNFNPTVEIIVILSAITLFIVFYFYPTIAQNWIANFFYQRIQIIIELPIIGFIFKIIGFFFLVSILFKIINGIAILLTGKPLFLVQRNFVHQNNRGNDDDFSNRKDDFDDYEEIN